MARIIAVYIAHGRDWPAARARGRDIPLDPEYIRQWQRLFCVFTIINALAESEDKPRFLAVTDHLPPAIDGRLIGFHLSRLGVELHRIDHIWRHQDPHNQREFFIFDVLDHLANSTTQDDQILIFSGQALVVNPLNHLFTELQADTVLFAEASYGELAEDHDRALSERMIDLRRHFGIGFSNGAIRAASTDFIGLNHAQLHSLMVYLRKLFMKNVLHASRGQDHFKSASELLAALLAQAGFYHSHLTGLSDRAAAMPDDFSMASLSDIPIIIPGYGREPDIPSLFDALIGDRLDAFHAVNKDLIFKLLRRDEKVKPFHKLISQLMPMRK